MAAVTVARATELRLLDRGPTWLAADKPAGLAVIPGRAETTSLLEQVAAALGLPSTGAADPRIRIVHRLDKETSGVVLMVTDRATQQSVSHQFQNNQVAKTYLAIACGAPAADDGTIDAPIGVHPTRPRQMAVLSHGGRPAVTEWRVLSRYRGFALLELHPRTGKTHQIRVHLAHIGLPLLNDPLYHPRGGSPLLLSEIKRGYRPSEGDEEKPLIARLALHAAELTVDLPDVGTKTFRAEAPKDFRAAINMLGKYAPAGRR